MKFVITSQLSCVNSHEFFPFIKEIYMTGVEPESRTYDSKYLANLFIHNTSTMFRKINNIRN